MDDIQILKTTIADLESPNDMDPAVLSGLKSYLELYRNYLSIDKALVATLKEQFQNGVKPKRELDNVMKTIDNGSIVVYFKSAQMFKVYQKDDIEKVLGGELRTFYKNLGQTYEVIPTDKEQKIIIIGDGSLVESLDKIKRYIVSFMNEMGLSTMAEKDIICYKNEGYVEIIINNYYVSNSSERKTIVNELLEYIKQKEKSVTLTDGLNRSYYSEITGADMVRTPPGKESIGGFIEPSSGLLTNLNRCHKIERANGGNTLVQIGSVSITTNTQVINNVGDGNQVVIGAKVNTIKEFLSHIKQTKPDWYVPEKLVAKQLIQEKYEELYGPVSYKKFHNMFYKKIFGDSVRSGTGQDRTTMVKLYAFNRIA